MIRIGAQVSGCEQTLFSQLQREHAGAAQMELRYEIDSSDADYCDDASALFAQADFPDRVRVITGALAQVDFATSVTAQAQLTIDLIRTQLNQIRSDSLSIVDPTCRPDQITVKRAKIDQALREIYRLAIEEFHHRPLLDGSCDFRVSGQNRSQVREVTVDRISGPTRLSAAKPATLIYHGKHGQLTTDADFTLTGPFGGDLISLTQNQSLAAAAEQINASTALTGVRSAAEGDQLSLESVFPGAEATLSVNVHFGQFDATDGAGKRDASGDDGLFAARPSIVGRVIAPAAAAGSEVTAEINGQLLTGERIVVNEEAAQFAIEFAAGFTGDFDPITLSDEGVWQFRLSTAMGDVTTLALPNLTPESLGGESGNLADLQSAASAAELFGPHDSLALRILKEAFSQLNQAEQRLDDFADGTIATSAALLAGLKASLEDSGEEAAQEDAPPNPQSHATQRQLAQNILASLATIGRQRTSVVRFLQIIEEVE
ncbi:hypothetical protein [Blastopirellula marina]|uniref:Flagellin N-terminal domain-containing protein n=1 Tax=Blastopirellula marina DSM 3645 TaxID=314230 RepID=A4A1U9_9BACT|nr:hypothetical protein [Blastopirellula marina]EAQ77239.1 hypothetical protein DSM3645_13355 [Blastopirellula marina DSM 3645]